MKERRWGGWVAPRGWEEGQSCEMKLKKWNPNKNTSASALALAWPTLLSILV